MNRTVLIEQLKQQTTRLSVGLLTADQMHLSGEIRLLEDAGVPLLHLDVMDGRVWPKLTAGAPVLAGYRSNKLLFDVHLLVDQPERHVDALAQAGADLISFMVETTDDIGGTLAKIGDADNTHNPGQPILRGVSLNPSTPLDTLHAHLDAIDFVVLLAVGPDTGKQSFFESIPDKIEQLREWKSDLLIFVDGAVTKDNIADIAAMQPDYIVTGSAVFDGVDPAGNLAHMQQAIQATLSGNTHE